MINYFSSDKYIQPESGDLLISEPFLPDANFERSVVFICEHNEEGTFGFVLNQLAQPKLSEIIDEADGIDMDVFIGGPVQRDTLHFLHQNPQVLKEDREVTNSIYWGNDFDDLLSAIDTKQIDSEDVKMFVGYSGWSPGQLEEELKAKSWIVKKNVTADIIFKTEPKSLWKAVLSQMGGKYKMIGNYPTDPRMN